MFIFGHSCLLDPPKSQARALLIVLQCCRGKHWWAAEMDQAAADAPGRGSTGRCGLGPRDQVRRLPHARAHRRARHQAAHPHGPRCGRCNPDAIHPDPERNLRLRWGW